MGVSARTTSGRSQECERGTHGRVRYTKLKHFQSFLLQSPAALLKLKESGVLLPSHRISNAGVPLR